MVSSFLTVASDTSCRNSKGYRCTFTKGGLIPFAKSGIVHCLPGNKAMHGLGCAYVREKLGCERANAVEVCAPSLLQQKKSMFHLNTV